MIPSGARFAGWIFVFSFLLGGWRATASSAATGPHPAADRGFAYRHEENAEMPWSIHIVKIHRTQTNMELHTTLGQGAQMGMGVVSEQVKSLPAELGRPVAAVNGDFFRNEKDCPGDAQGLQIARGELVSGPSPTRVCFWMDPAGQPHRDTVIAHFQVTWPDGTKTPFGLNEERATDAAVLYTPAKGSSTRAVGGTELVLERNGADAWLPLRVGQTLTARVREVRTVGDAPLDRDRLVLSLGPKLAAQVPKVEAGARLQISTATMPDLTGTQTAIGGSPTLVSGGNAAKWTGTQLRHPRTAIGWNKNFIFLVEVDGRQSRLSIGMTLPELAAYMAKLGCDEAMNLDGGGSATLWVYGNVMNSPSEGHERPAANALVVVDKSKRRSPDPHD